MCVTNTTTRRSQQPVSLAGAVAAAPTLNLAEALAQQQALSASPYAATAAPKSYGSFPTYSAAAPQHAAFMTARPAEKPRPKRRRKPQKPGKTAKMNDRHFVHHDYHDHSADAAMEAASGERRKGGVSIAFPVKLHAVLDQVEADGLGHIVSWQPHGRCFVIHKPKEFVEHVMPK